VGHRGRKGRTKQTTIARTYCDVVLDDLLGDGSVVVEGNIVSKSSGEEEEE